MISIQVCNYWLEFFKRRWIRIQIAFCSYSSKTAHYFLWYLSILVLLFASFACRNQDDPNRQIPKNNSDPAPAGGYQRIISLAPSITESIYLIGAGDRIVGVTKFCRYPSEAQNKVQVGGLFDPNYEAMLRLSPDLAVIFKVHDEQKLNSLGIRTLVVNHDTVQGIIDSLISMGNAVGQSEKATREAQTLTERIKQIELKTKDLDHPTVLISVGRTIGSGSIKDVYISGSDGFYNDLVQIAGGVNVYSGLTVSCPSISSEGILKLNPDIIIDIVPENVFEANSELEIMRDWEELKDVNAVKNKRISILGSAYATVPGPRFIILLQDFVRVIHPEVHIDA